MLQSIALTIAASIAVIGEPPTLLAQCMGSFDLGSTASIVMRLPSLEGKSFVLIESETGYGIYDENGTFYEGAFDSHSPYTVNGYGADHRCLYLGPMMYYVLEDGVLLDITTNEQLDSSLLQDPNLKVPEVVYSENLPTAVPASSPTNTHIDENGFICIGDDILFRDWTGTKIPNNSEGTCGYVSLTMYLIWLDTYKNGQIVPLYLNHGNVSPIYRPSWYKDMSGTSNYPIESWEAYPYPTQGFHDYLVEYYPHTLFGISGEEGHPMTADHLEQCFWDFCENESGVGNRLSLNDIQTVKETAGWDMEGALKSLINSGYPAIMTLKDGNYGTSLPARSSITSGWHNPLVYGYKETNNQVYWLCNPGWRSYSSATIFNTYSSWFSYVAFKYNGQHQHGYNARANYLWMIYDLCACGANTHS